MRLQASARAEGFQTKRNLLFKLAKAKLNRLSLFFSSARLQICAYLGALMKQLNFWWDEPCVFEDLEAHAEFIGCLLPTRVFLHRSAVAFGCSKFTRLFSLSELSANFIVSELKWIHAVPW
jgi:hypothetical protein